MPLDEQRYDHDDAVLKLLIKTDSILATKRNWMKGGIYPLGGEKTGPYCILGALWLGDGFRSREAVVAQILLTRLTPRGISAFNDNPSTTFADIKALLRRAIEARQKELVHAV